MDVELEAAVNRADNGACEPPPSLPDSTGTTGAPDAAGVSRSALGYFRLDLSPDAVVLDREIKNCSFTPPSGERAATGAAGVGAGAGAGAGDHSERSRPNGQAAVGAMLEAAAARTNCQIMDTVADMVGAALRCDPPESLTYLRIKHALVRQFDASAVADAGMKMKINDMLEDAVASVAAKEGALQGRVIEAAEQLIEFCQFRGKQPT